MSNKRPANDRKRPQHRAFFEQALEAGLPAQDAYDAATRRLHRSRAEKRNISEAQRLEEKRKQRLERGECRDCGTRITPEDLKRTPGARGPKPSGKVCRFCRKRVRKYKTGLH